MVGRRKKEGRKKVEEGEKRSDETTSSPLERFGTRDEGSWYALLSARELKFLRHPPSSSSRNAKSRVSSPRVSRNYRPISLSLSLSLSRFLFFCFLERGRSIEKISRNMNFHSISRRPEAKYTLSYMCILYICPWDILIYNVIKCYDILEVIIRTFSKSAYICINRQKQYF